MCEHTEQLPLVPARVEGEEVSRGRLLIGEHLCAHARWCVDCGTLFVAGQGNGPLLATLVPRQVER
jgi:hypothetical protein